MKHATSSIRLLRVLTFTTVIGLGGLFTASSAHASEIKFGEGPSSLATDDTGKLTDAGRKTALKELDKMPGEDAWDLRLWAKLDKGAAGPLYIEFWQTIDVMGKKQTNKVFHHEDPNYDGSKLINYSVLLEGKLGFNKNRTYNVYVVQVNAKGKDVRLASSKLKLINTGREPEEEEGGDEEEEASEQDELDGLGGDDAEEETDEKPNEAPPETDASKKGCSVDTGAGGLNGALILLVLGGAGWSRRRRT